MRPDPVLLASGMVTAVLGALVLLRSSGVIGVSPGWSAVILTGSLGAILLVSGLAGSSPDRHD